ncbi:MAG: PHB depolymerase family esterase [Hyphomicrobium sp.]
MSHTSVGGTRDYKLYIPSSYDGRPMPLIVMLHGCTQSAADFADGTGMNGIAEGKGFLVAYPEQTASANANKCWNWFNSRDQKRDGGEPSIIAGIARDIIANYAIDTKRVYVAGLSAGGAAAAILGTTYPDLFAAIGVHSGLPVGSASDLSSALAAMHSPKEPSSLPHGAILHGRGRLVPTIVFHGDRDRTVHLRNGHHVIEQSRRCDLGELRADSQHGHVQDGHMYTRTQYRDAAGRVLLEMWVVHGAGHAWSGGRLEGSFTDPRGPDASREMARFFLEHPLPRS